MAENSTIEWTDATWNPITGCTLVSEGCRHCYAATLAASRLKNHPSRAGLARINAAGAAKFTGEVRFNEQWLDQPLRWKRPRMIFVCAHGDLFHEGVPDEWIDRVFAVMALAPQHTFQVLTKRPARAQAYFAHDEGFGRWGYIEHHARQIIRDAGGKEPGRKTLAHFGGSNFPHVWLGTSVEDQATADARIPHLLATPAAVRFVSAEPLLGPVDLIRMLDRAGFDPVWSIRQAGLGWVIAGGESGPGARPMHPGWARSLRDQCQAAGVAFFFKQWGEWAPISEIEVESGALYHPAPETEPEASRRLRVDCMCLDADGTQHDLGEAGGFHRCPAGAFAGDRPMSMVRVGKKAAGRLLDGREWSQMPGVRNG